MAKTATIQPIKPTTTEATMADSPFPLFLAYLATHPDEIKTMNPTTFARYASGGLPAPMIWFLEHPGALAALAKDAGHLTPEQMEAIKAMVNDRSEAQRKYRKKKAAPKGRRPKR